MKTRREFIRDVSLTSLASGVIPLSIADPKKLKVLCVGAHPDDPESGCGGTLAKLSAAGHTVKVIYLTRGEAGIEGKSHGESAEIRSREANAACKILNVEPIFAGQIDGDTVVNAEWIDKISRLIQTEKPDIVFTHWPIDSHKDHQVASLLATQAWMRAKDKFQLYYFEVCTGNQTVSFQPTDYVDISQFQEMKKKAVYCHASQDPPSIYDCGHAIMEKFRGIEFGVAAAEAFVCLKVKNAGGFAF